DTSFPSSMTVSGTVNVAELQSGTLYNALNNNDAYLSLIKDYTYATKIAIEDLNNFSSVPGYAEGGIASGSESGHLAMLHGTEAVIPLKSGNVPVTVTGDNNNNKDLIEEIKQMRMDLKAANKQIIRLNTKINNRADKWDNNGFPGERAS
ncbi:MAG TPA: hypothetical protein VJ951_01670, partial [Bacteroidales bacterium]|nr:hypothetical protein [Bacteroidales bacterium]